jgi:hypothetical protein
VELVLARLLGLIALEEDDAAALVAGGQVVASLIELDGGDNIGFRYVLDIALVTEAPKGGKELAKRHSVPQNNLHRWLELFKSPDVRPINGIAFGGVGDSFRGRIIHGYWTCHLCPRLPRQFGHLLVTRKHRNILGLFVVVDVRVHIGIAVLGRHRRLILRQVFLVRLVGLVVPAERSDPVGALDQRVPEGGKHAGLSMLYGGDGCGARVLRCALCAHERGTLHASGKRMERQYEKEGTLTA